MTSDRIQQIEQAITALGDQWTNRLVYERVGGNYQTLAEHLKQRRAQAHEAAATAALEPLAVGHDAVVNHAPPQTPLAKARGERDRTHAAEHALGLEEQRLKVQRQGLEQAVLRWEASAARQTNDAFDLEARRQLRELRTQLLQVEAQRRAVHQRRREAHVVLLEATEAFDALDGQARRWLRRLREGQRQAVAGETAQARGDAREELDLAQGELARLVGLAEARTLADDPTRQPDWLRG